MLKISTLDDLKTDIEKNAATHRAVINKKGMILWF
jgi:hypothetical protein